MKLVSHQNCRHCRSNVHAAFFYLKYLYILRIAIFHSKKLAQARNRSVTICISFLHLVRDSIHNHIIHNTNQYVSKDRNACLYIGHKSIIVSEVWTITYCLWLGHETMVCAVCLSVFLWISNHINYIVRGCTFYANLWSYLLILYIRQRTRRWSSCPLTNYVKYLSKI